MLNKNNKNLKSVVEKNKQNISNRIESSKQKQKLYEDVLVLEILEPGVKSKYILNHVCNSGIQLVCAYAHLHNHYFPHTLTNMTVDQFRSVFGSNGNIVGREFKLEINSFSKKDIERGKIMLIPTDKELDEKEKNIDSDISFSLGNLNQIAGAMIDRFEWKYIEPKKKIGYIWSQIIPTKDINNV
jgi:hypothetical protein